MISNQSTRLNPIVCMICRHIIDDHKHIYQSKETLTVFCDDCRKKFSDKDIDLIANLFFAHGGYFGEKRTIYSSLNGLLGELLKDAKLKHKRISLDDLNIKLFHKVLIHGITPHEFLEMLKTSIE